MVRKAAAAERFKGKLGTTLDIVLPAELEATRLIVVGCGHARELKAPDYLRLGGIAMGKVPAAAGELTILAELPYGFDHSGSSVRRPGRGTWDTIAGLFVRPLQDQTKR